MMTARRDPLEQQLHKLALLGEQPIPARNDPGYAVRQTMLRNSLTAKSNFAVAAAADLLRESDTELLALLENIFRRFLINSVQTDKVCAAKTAIARALERVEFRDESVFLLGLFHVQMEPVWGGKQDTAVELRSICAMGLARISPPGVANLLAQLLADKERGARAAACRALGCSALVQAVPLLRFKALTGDDDPQVLTECWTALLLLERASALPFIKRFLNPQDEVIADAVVLALGQSRLPEVIPLLCEYAETPPRDQRKAALVALAMLRLAPANEYLLELVRDAEPRLAGLAVEALALHRFDTKMHRSIAELVQGRRNQALKEAFDRAFTVSNEREQEPPGKCR